MERKLFTCREILEFCNKHEITDADVMDVYDDETNSNFVAFAEYYEYIINNIYYCIYYVKHLDKEKNGHLDYVSIRIMKSRDTIFFLCMNTRSKNLENYEVRKFNALSDVGVYHNRKRLMIRLSSNLEVKEDTKKKTKI